MSRLELLSAFSIDYLCSALKKLFLHALLGSYISFLLEFHISLNCSSFLVSSSVHHLSCYASAIGLTFHLCRHIWPCIYLILLSDCLVLLPTFFFDYFQHLGQLNDCLYFSFLLILPSRILLYTYPAPG